MERRAKKAGWFACLVCVVLLCNYFGTPLGAADRSSAKTKGILIYPERQSHSDLAISGMIRGLPEGATGYVRYADLATLPKVTFTIHRDENFRELAAGHGLRATGIYLHVLARSLGALSASDLIDASCTDGYRGHYPASYIAQHHPILVLTLEHRRIADWARENKHYDPGPYFISHADFVPAFKVLAHEDRPQVPSGIVRLNFSTIAATYGAIAPRGSFAAGSPQEEGFLIARQNCLRCHNQGVYGGEKAGRTWMTLSTWAREQPAYFENYVHDPKAFDEHAKMPGNPEYDKATLHALSAYFRTFLDTASPDGSTQGH